MFEKVAIIGGSRGLGAAIALQLKTHARAILIVARNQPQWIESNIHFFKTDLSQPQQISALVDQLNEFQPQQIIYCAGGGPFGIFSKNQWTSHQWALQVSFLSAAEIFHKCLDHSHLKQFVFIGSSVAEAQADPFASTYCAAKHALVGLHASVAKEKSPVDVRLFSPGYIDTDLLPPGSWPRQQEKQIWPPQFVAEKLLQWSSDKNFQNQHYRLPIWQGDLEK